MPEIAPTTRNVETQPLVTEESLTKLFGNEKWRKCNDLFYCSQFVLEQRAKVLTSIFGGDSWKNHPNLLISDLARIQSNSESHTSAFGSQDWVIMHSLVTVSPRTFKAGLRALATIGITPQSHPVDVCYLLGLTNDTKMRKANYIRRELLKHTHIFWDTRSQSIGDCISRFKALSVTDKQNQQKELRDLARFLQRYPRVMTMSEHAIYSWAQNKNFNFN